MKIITYIFILISAFSLSGVIYLLLENNNDSKAVYFLSAEVYNAFDYKVELEKELNDIGTKNKNILDSLETNYQLSINALNGVEPNEDELIVLKRKQKSFFELKEKLENRFSDFQQDSYNKIWERINGFVKTYGKENNLAYIFGANGDGSVMYADENNNITKDIISYVNSKYNGE